MRGVIAVSGGGVGIGRFRLVEPAQLLVGQPEIVEGGRAAPPLLAARRSASMASRQRACFSATSPMKKSALASPGRSSETRRNSRVASSNMPVL